MHYSASTIILKRLVREISSNQNVKQLISHSESLRAMERGIFCQIEASEGKTFYSTKKKNNLPNTLITQTIVGGGGYRGVQTSHLSYSVHELCIPRSSLIFLSFVPFSPFSITKYEALLHNFPLFLQPSPMHFPLLPPTPLLPPIFLGSHLPVLTRTSYNFLFWTTCTLNFS